MSHFLEELFLNAEDVELSDCAMLEPNAKREEGDQVIGVLPKRLRKLYIVVSRYGETLCKQCHMCGQCAALSYPNRAWPKLNCGSVYFASNSFIAFKRFELAVQALRLEIIEAFPILVASEGYVGLCRDWEVVISGKYVHSSYSFRLSSRACSA